MLRHCQWRKEQNSAWMSFGDLYGATTLLHVAVEAFTCDVDGCSCWHLLIENVKKPAKAKFLGIDDNPVAAVAGVHMSVADDDD
jgi:hypothetical protein